MKVLGRATSGNVQKVLFLLEETGTDYTREDYGRQFGNTDSAEYLALNPTGKVPTLIDGKVTVWESHAILRYVAAKLKSPLYPQDVVARAGIDPWMDWLLATLNGTYVTIFKAAKGGGEVSDASAAELRDALTLLDARLGNAAFLAGEVFSIADVALGPIVHRCLGFPVELPALEHLRTWHSRLADREAFAKVVG